MPIQHPVLVVGGGIAGLTTAWTLQQQGTPVIVLEATPHLGGRMHSVPEHGGLLETGMQFYYGGYREAKRLLTRFGLRDQLLPIDVRGKMVWQDALHPFSKTKPWLSALPVRENLRLFGKILGKLAPMLGHSVFDYAADEAADQVDVAEFFSRHGDDGLLELVARPLTTSYAFVEPEGHSLAMLLRILKLGALSGTYGLRAGNDALARALAKELTIQHARVSHVIVDDGRARGVVTEDGRTLDASAVVLATGGLHAGQMLTDAAPAVASRLAELSYSSVVLANLHLDRPLPESDPDWVFVMSRKAGHTAAFAIDLMRRAPQMFPGGNSMVQVNFATPSSDAVIDLSDEAIVAQALADLAPFAPRIADYVSHTSVVRRRKTHPNFACGMQGQIRAIQSMVSGIEGLELAGDYLRSPLCEGAIRSGLDTAKRLSQGPMARREAPAGVDATAARAA